MHTIQLELHYLSMDLNNLIAIPSYFQIILIVYNIQIFELNNIIILGCNGMGDNQQSIRISKEQRTIANLLQSISIMVSFG